MALATLSVSAAAVDPVAASGTFVDDDGSVHEGFIEAIALERITYGCNPPANDRFCPNVPVSRGQMAAFIVRGLDLGPAQTDWFEDDNGSLFEPAINALAAAGITAGCNPPDNTFYCPAAAVSRGQMAAFLVRAFGYPPAMADWFDDDNGSLFEDSINALAAVGISQGCNPPDNNRYCPNAPVTRGQMATFLGRALGLDPIEVWTAGAHFPSMSTDVSLHVDQSHPDATDANPGTVAAPFLTISAALLEARGLRDVGTAVRVVVHPGVYREELLIESAGPQPEPLLILEAADPGTVVVSGADEWSAWTHLGNDRYRHAWPYEWGEASLPPNWDPVAVSPLLRRRELVVHDGEPLAQVATAANLAANTFVVDEQANTLTVQLTPGSPASGLEVGIRDKVLHVRRTENVVVRGMTFRNAATPIDTSAVLITVSQNVLFEDNAVERNNWGGVGIHVFSNVSVVRSNASSNGGRGIAASEGKGLLVEDSETSYNNWRGSSQGFVEWSTSGIKILLTHASVIRNHQSLLNLTSGVWLDTDISGLVLDGIESIDNLTDGIAIEASQGPVSVTRSTSRGNGRWGLATSNAIYLTISDSTFEQNSGATQVHARNDVATRTVVDWETGVTHHIPPGHSWNLMRLVVAGAPAGGRAFGLSPGGYQTAFLDTLTSDDNRWCGSDLEKLFDLGNGYRVGLETWKSLSGQDQDSTAHELGPSCPT